MLVNHKGAVGEIGQMVNHSVYQKGTIGGQIVNHKLDDGAPRPNEIIQFKCNETTLAKELGLYSYPVRSLSVSNPGNIFLLGEELKDAFFWLKRHYSRIGLACAEKAFYNDYDFSLANEPELSNSKLSVFFYGPDAFKVRPNCARFRSTKLFNNKVKCFEVAWSLDCPTPITWQFSSKNQIQDCSDFLFPVAIKIGNSVSGLGFSVCRTREELEKTLDLVPENEDFQIQVFSKGAKFYSMQWWGSDNGIAIPITGTCNFIAGDANHLGNWGGVKIPHKELVLFTAKIAHTAVTNGLRDWFSFDVMEHNGKFYLLECNPRYTGAAYPFIALTKLLGHKKALKVFWAHKTYPSSFKSINQLDLGELEYNPKKEEGWVAINPGPLSVGDGKISLLWTGPEEKYKKAEDDLQNIL